MYEGEFGGAAPVPKHLDIPRDVLPAAQRRGKAPGGGSPGR